MNCSCCVCGTPDGDADNSNNMEGEGDDIVVGEDPLEAVCRNLFFHAEISKPLKPCSLLQIKGDVLHDCERFAVNLLHGNPDLECGQDIALHLNPRIPQNYVVRNTRSNGYWGEEEVTSTSSFPFKRGEEFDIIVYIGKNEYLIAFNGQHFCAFSFRTPVEYVSHIQVVGDVFGVTVDQREEDFYPVPHKKMKFKTIDGSDYKYPNHISNPKDLAVPFMGRFHAGFPTGKQVRIEGRIKLLPHSFFFNLQSSEFIYPHPVIPLHLNPRFTGGSPYFIRNSWVENGWGKEQRSTGHYFTPGKPFRLIIKCESTQYSVYSDDIMIAYYPFQVAPTIVKFLYIQGDLELSLVKFEKCSGPSDDMSLSELVEKVRQNSKV